MDLHVKTIQKCQKTLNADRQADVHSLAIKLFDSCTVGVSGELVHGSMDMRKKEGKAGDPEVAQLLPWPEGRPHLRGELVVVVGHVPYKPQQVPDGGAGVAPPLP